MTIRDAMRGPVIGLHLALAVVLAVIALPQVLRLKEQLDSGYMPPYTLFLVVVVALPLVLAALMMRGLVLWSRGRRGYLIAVDVATALASWSVLLVYVFSNDVPIAAVFLAPAAVLGAAFAPRAVA